MLIVVAISIAVAAVVAPSPVFLLFFGRKLAKVTVGIAMVLVCPLMVVGNFVVVPNVIVSVVRIVNTIRVVPCTIHTGRRYKQYQDQ